MTATSSSLAYTVAICTHNHAGHLQKTLQEFGKVLPSVKPFELLIVDNASSDATPQILDRVDWRRPDGDTRVVLEQRLGVANARNRAVKEARGEYLIFLDDDESPDLNWLTTYEEAIERWQPDALGGPYELELEQQAPPWLQEDLLGFLGKLHHGPEPKRLTDPATHLYTGNFAFRREIFERIGLFDPDLGRRGSVNAGGEDVEMYRRILAAGLDIRWVPDAIIYHRIQSNKLRKGYFYELHYHQGLLQGREKRGDGPRSPPLYLFPQLGRAIKAALSERIRNGADFSVRKEMNVVYFIGYILGWISR